MQSELRNLLLLQNELLIYEEPDDAGRIQHLAQDLLNNIFGFTLKLQQFTSLIPTLPAKKLPKSQQQSSLLY